MTEQEMWDAVEHCDSDYDGLFFYGVKTTGIFCRPSCRSKTPKRDNVCFFASAAKARAAGFRPCKRCRSDLLEYRPMQDIAAAVKEKIERAVSAQEDLAAALHNVGLTPRRLTDVFRGQYGVTPREYADSLRLQTAERLLSRTDEKIIDIAYAAGFSSLSTFNRFFKAQTGQTPSAYRKAHQDQA